MTKYLILGLLILIPVVLYIVQRINLNYYKLNGRKPIEIECWLKTRKWYNLFIDEIKNEILEDDRVDNGQVLLSNELMQDIQNRIDYIVSGCDDTATISNAFFWRTSLQGIAYWGKRAYEFLRWYYGQYVDFHLVK